MPRKPNFPSVLILAVVLLILSVPLFATAAFSQMQQQAVLHRIPPKVLRAARMQPAIVHRDAILFGTLGCMSLALGVGLLMIRQTALETDFLKRSAGLALAQSSMGIEVLLEALEDDEHTQWARTFLGQVRDPAVAAGYARHLSDPRSRVRRMAAEVLERTRWQPETPHERALLEAALGNFEEAASVGEASLDALVLGTTGARSRRDALRALPKLGAIAVKPLIEAYKECLQKADWQGVQWAAESLGSLGADAAAAVHILADSSRTPSIATCPAQADAWSAAKAAVKDIQVHLDW